MLSIKIAVSVTLGLLCWNIFGEVIAQRDVDERKRHMRQASQEFSTDKGKGQLNMNDRPTITIPAPKFEQYSWSHSSGMIRNIPRKLPAAGLTWMMAMAAGGTKS